MVSEHFLVWLGSHLRSFGRFWGHLVHLWKHSRVILVSSRSFLWPWRRNLDSKYDLASHLGIIRWPNWVPRMAQCGQSVVNNGVGSMCTKFSKMRIVAASGRSQRKSTTPHSIWDGEGEPWFEHIRDLQTPNSLSICVIISTRARFLMTQSSQLQHLSLRSCSFQTFHPESAISSFY